MKRSILVCVVLMLGVSGHAECPSADVTGDCFVDLADLAAVAHPWTTPVGFYDGLLQYKADFNWPDSRTTYQTTSGANGYGLFDMAGNVREWCNDWYAGDYYDSSPMDNPTGPSDGGHRVFRGGIWFDNEYRCRVASRFYDTRSHRSFSVGFRIVLDHG